MASVTATSANSSVVSSASSSSSSSSPTTTTDPSDVCTLWILRHGERADEVMSSKIQFYASTDRNHWHDPPLTAAGLAQADYVAYHLHRLYSHVHHNYNIDHYRYETRHYKGMKEKRHQEREKEQVQTIQQTNNEGETSSSDSDSSSASESSSSSSSSVESSSSSSSTRTLPFSRLYVSPLLRTIQTAAMVGRRLNIDAQIVYGLSECAAAVRKSGVHKALFYTKEEAMHHCRKNPLTVVSHIDDHLRESFATACERLCMQHAGSELLLISHREAIRDLLLATGMSHHQVRTYQLRYCCVAAFQYHIKTKKWSVLLQPTNLV